MADLIDRQAVIDEICNKCFIGRKFCTNLEPCENIQIIESVPTAQPTRSEIRRLAIQNEVFPAKRGEWEYFMETSFNGEITEIDDCGWRCSCCKTPLADVVRGYWDDDSEKPTINFCPNCGADMRKKENNDDWTRRN